jgi:hypothetical protein
MLHVYIEPRCDTCDRAEYPMKRNRMFTAAQIACLCMGIMRYTTLIDRDAPPRAFGCRFIRREYAEHD